MCMCVSSGCVSVDCACVHVCMCACVHEYMGVCVCVMCVLCERVMVCEKGREKACLNFLHLKFLKSSLGFKPDLAQLLSLFFTPMTK